MSSSNPYDIDAWTNPYTPEPPFRHLPVPIAHVFGYRQPGSKPQQPHVLLLWTFCFIGAFCGVSLIEVVYLHLPHLNGHSVPTIIASFGASAILEYNVVESPLAQPRNLVLGHFLSVLTGVSITKLFRLLPYAKFDELRWLAGALSVGAASVVMSVTKTVHPPAGAAALLCATDAAITELSWWYLALILLGCMLMLTSALFINNFIRQFPIYWWTAIDLKSIKKPRKGDARDIEKASQAKRESEEPMAAKRILVGGEVSSSEDTDATSSTNVTSISPSTQHSGANNPMLAMKEHQILIDQEKIVIPDWLQTDDWEHQILRILHLRLKSGPGGNNGRG